MIDTDSDNEVQNNEVSSDLREQTKVFFFLRQRISNPPSINLLGS